MSETLVLWGEGRSARLRDTSTRNRPELTVELDGGHMRIHSRNRRLSGGFLMYHPAPTRGDEYRFVLGVLNEPPAELSFRTQPVVAAVVDRFVFAVVDRDSEPMIIDVDGEAIGALSGPPEAPLG